MPIPPSDSFISSPTDLRPAAPRVTRRRYPSAPDRLWEFTFHPLDGPPVTVITPDEHRAVVEARAASFLAALDIGVDEQAPPPRERLRLA